MIVFVLVTDPLAGAANVRALPASTQRHLIAASQAGSAEIDKNTQLTQSRLIAASQAGSTTVNRQTLHALTDVKGASLREIVFFPIWTTSKREHSTLQSSVRSWRKLG